MGFAEKLIEKRTQAGLTQEELAERCGLTARSIQNYETGARRPGLSVTQKLAGSLNTSPEYLFQSCWTSGTDGSVPDDRVPVQAVEELREQFLSGILRDDQLDDVMKTLWQAYWQARGVR